MLDETASNLPLALTFDDVLLLPGKSSVLPADVDLRTRLAGSLYLNLPILSAAMDTVTESRMAIGMARLGGLGVIHRNLSPEAQAAEVDRVKQVTTGITMQADAPLAVYDAQGRLLCGAALGVGEAGLARLERLVEAGLDIAVIDTAHGHTDSVLGTLAEARRRYPALIIIAGNVATPAGVRDLIQAGADAVKVGVGAGAICTTRIIAGVGVPQLSAIQACAAEAQRQRIPLIADGGIRYSGDIVKALAMGADAVMLGSMLAGVEESPGDILLHEGKRYKAYRGMGSLGAMRGHGADRYGSGQAGERSKLVPEGIEGQVPYTGRLDDIIYQMVGGLRAGMGYVGAADLAELRAKAHFVRITNAGLLESHPHTVVITQAAPNYQARR